MRAAFVAPVALASALLSGCGLFAQPRIMPAADSTLPGSLGPEVRPPVSLASGPEDAVVRVIGPAMSCTGTLIARDLVLTAHHCIVQRGRRGEFESQPLRPEEVHVELGGDYLAWGEVGVRAVVAPPCGEAGGGGDVAVLVLDRALRGATTVPVRLDGAPRVGELLAPVGFGRCTLTSDGIRRKRRGGGAVQALRAETIEMMASVCPGDSGGPVLSPATGEVVGVVSLSALDHDERTVQASLMARVDKYRLVFAQARQIADGATAAELPPLACDH